MCIIFEAETPPTRPEALVSTASYSYRHYGVKSNNNGQRFKGTNPYYTRAGLKRYQVGKPILKTDHCREEQASDINKVFHNLLQKKRKKVGKLLGHVSHYYEFTSRVWPVNTRQEARDLWFCNAQNKVLLDY